MEPGAGRLLVATPALVDPNFARTIVLLLDVADDGVLGVVLNRPLEVGVEDVLGSWAGLVVGPRVLFGGGPVQTEAALAVARVGIDGGIHADASTGGGGAAHPEATAADQPEEPLGWRRLTGDLGLVDLDAPTELLGDVVSSLRIFAGYAGWSRGQLEEEIAEGAWLVVAAEPGDPFLEEPGLLWSRVLRRQGGAVAMLATQPADPAHN